MQLTPEQEAAFRRYLQAEAIADEKSIAARNANAEYEDAKTARALASNTLRELLAVTGHNEVARLVEGDRVYTISANGRIGWENAYFVSNEAKDNTP